MLKEKPNMNIIHIYIAKLHSTFSPLNVGADYNPLVSKNNIGAGNPEGNVHSTVRKKQVIQFPALGIFPSQADALRRRVGWSAVAQDSHRRCGGTLVKIELKNFVWVQKNGWWSFCSLKKNNKNVVFLFSLCRFKVALFLGRCRVFTTCRKMSWWWNF